MDTAVAVGTDLGSLHSGRADCERAVHEHLLRIPWQYGRRRCGITEPAGEKAAARPGHGPVPDSPAGSHETGTYQGKQP